MIDDVNRRPCVLNKKVIDYIDYIKVAKGSHIKLNLRTKLDREMWYSAAENDVKE